MKSVGLIGLFSFSIVVLSACAASLGNSGEGTPLTESPDSTNAVVAGGENGVEPEVFLPDSSSYSASCNTPIASITKSVESELIEGQSPPSGASAQFSTDFSIHTVDFSDVLSGGPPKDGIPAIDQPAFVSVGEADEWLADAEPVVLFEYCGESRAYPIQILMWHEIVNDIVAGEPVSITFCPLCNTAIVFSGLVGDLELNFGTTGRLRYSNLIMYDRQTETWWQQANGEAIAGELTGAQLTFLPASLISWRDFKSRFPDALVLSQQTGHARNYGINPYGGYDDINSFPFLLRGADTPDTLPPMARVITVEIGGEAVAYPYETMQSVGVVNDEIGGVPIVVFWQPGVASALDTQIIASGEDVGTAVAFSSIVNDEALEFASDGNEIRDIQTGSRWSILGEAVDGKLQGVQLNPVVSINHFWFSWAAFKPETSVYQP
jgi:hypothetical protein